MQSVFKRNLIIGFCVSLFLLLGSSIASYISISSLLNSARLVNNTNKVLDDLDAIIANLRDCETGQRGYLLTGEEEFLEPYQISREKLPKLISNINLEISNSPAQVADANELGTIIQKRLTSLQRLINDKRKGNALNLDYMRQGKAYMDEARLVIGRMEDRENADLLKRTQRMNDFAASTPLLIILASLLALLVTIVAFYKVSSDFERNLGLQAELTKKDEETQHRIQLIDEIARQISAGNFASRIADGSSDILGSLGSSLNKMASSLEESFEKLSRNEWLQTGLANLNTAMLGDKSVRDLAESILGILITYTKSHAGVCYVITDSGDLQLLCGYSVDRSKLPAEFKSGESLVGQVALTKKLIQINDIPENELMISFSMGVIKPASVTGLPLIHNNIVKAVIEISALHNFSEDELLFLNEASGIAGLAVNLAQNRFKVRQLLSETQAQAEELQTQHTELENINSELEVQAQKLQSSEEELKVQQEELIQTNQELEEGSRLLEEKNQLIVERNMEIQKKAELLELSTKYKSEFLANMSHELRTPLNSILLLSKLLAENNDKNLSDEQIEYAKVIQSIR